MVVSETLLVDMLLKYINRGIGLPNLIDWAEDMIWDAEIEDNGYETIKDILARIGLADVREFGLTWDDCYDYLQKLGYDVKVELSEVK